MLIFTEGRKPENPAEKNPQGKREQHIKQTQLSYGTTAVGDERFIIGHLGSLDGLY
jgi:hypothetical protein